MSQMTRADVAALLQPTEDSMDRLELDEADQGRKDASRPDADFQAVPMKGPFGFTALVRHASLATGFDFEELDPLLERGQGFPRRLAGGGIGPRGTLRHLDPSRLVDFVNWSRAARAADPQVDLHRWWKTKRPRRRQTPFELLVEGRVMDPIMDPYRAELGTPDHVVKQGWQGFVDEPSVVARSR